MPDAGNTQIPAKLWVLIGASFVIAIGYGLMAPILPAYAQSFTVGITAASALISIFAFFRLIFAPAGGRLITRLGERSVFLGGLVIMAAATLATAAAQSYGALLTYRSIAGIGATLFTISALALIIRLAPPATRGKVSSAYTSALLIGGLIGPVIGGFLAAYGMRLPFLIYGFALIVATIVVAVGLKDLPSLA